MITNNVRPVFEVTRDNRRSRRPLEMTSSVPNMWCKSSDRHINLEEDISSFPVSTVPADGLAPSGARPSAGTMLVKFGSRTFTYTALKGLCTPFGMLITAKSFFDAILCFLCDSIKSNGRLQNYWYVTQKECTAMYFFNICVFSDAFWEHAAWV